MPKVKKTAHPFSGDVQTERVTDYERYLQELFEPRSIEEPNAVAEATTHLPTSGPRSGREYPQAVELFNAEDLAIAYEVASKDRDHKAATRAKLEQLHSLGPTRKLATFGPDWKNVLNDLAAEFPNFSEVIAVLREHFSLNALTDSRLSFPSMLWNGPPGIGKTEFARELAARFDQEVLYLDMAAAQSGSALSGSDQFFSNARPGRLFDMCPVGRVANPIIVLDEIDKISADPRWDPVAALYGLLEKTSAKKFYDLAIPELVFDASHINWIALSNRVDTIEPALLSRFQAIEILAPTRVQQVAIVHSLYRKLRNQNAWGSFFVDVLSDDVAWRLAIDSPRRIRQCLVRGFGRAAEAGRDSVTIDDVADLVESPINLISPDTNTH